MKDSNLTLAMKSGYTARVDADGNELRRLPDGPAFPTISGADFARVIHGPQPVNEVARQIRENLGHSANGLRVNATYGDVPAPQNKPASPLATEGARSTLPFAAGSQTSESAAVSMADTHEAQRARVLAYLRSCRYEGATDLEGEAALALDGSSYRPRRVKLAELGLIVLNGEERLTASNRKAVVWVAAEFAPPAAVLPPNPANPEPARVEIAPAPTLTATAS